ncbi:MAG: hypothetical protein SVU32_04820, partial [Candidatus Nanohaloarchaea archaeon]|nr:hypothetical protein [Candidatus Nanohaloarchaea archaeon]
EPGNKKVLYSNRTLDQSCTFEVSEQLVTKGVVISRRAVLTRLLSQPFGLRQQFARIAAGGRSITASVTVALDDQRTGTVSRLFSQAVAADLSELRTFGAGRLSIAALGYKQFLTRTQVLERVLEEPYAVAVDAVRALVLDRLVTVSIVVDRAVTVQWGLGRILDQVVAFDPVLEPRSVVFSRVRDTVFDVDDRGARALVLERLVDAVVGVGQRVTTRVTTIVTVDEQVGFAAAVRRGLVLERVATLAVDVGAVPVRDVDVSRLVEAVFAVDEAVEVTRLPVRDAGVVIEVVSTVPERVFTGGRLIETLVSVSFVPSREVSVARLVDPVFVFGDGVSQSIHFREVVTGTVVFDGVVTRVFEGARSVAAVLGFDASVLRVFSGSRSVDMLPGFAAVIDTTGKSIFAVDERFNAGLTVARTVYLGREDAVLLQITGAVERAAVLGRMVDRAVVFELVPDREVVAGRAVGQVAAIGISTVRQVAAERDAALSAAVSFVSSRDLVLSRAVRQIFKVDLVPRRLNTVSRLVVFDAGFAVDTFRSITLSRAENVGVMFDAVVGRRFDGFRTVGQVVAAVQDVTASGVVGRLVSLPIRFSFDAARSGLFGRGADDILDVGVFPSRLSDVRRLVVGEAVFADAVVPVRLLGRDAVQDVGLVSTVSRSLTLYRVRETLAGIVFRPSRLGVVARRSASRFDIALPASRLFAGGRGTVEALSVTEGIAVTRGLLRTVDGPVGFVLLPSRGVAVARAVDQVYGLLPRATRQLVLSRIPSRVVTVVTEEVAYAERVADGTVTAGDVSETRVDDGTVKEIEEDTFVDDLNATELFRTQLDQDEVTKLRFGANAWREGDAEAIDVYLYRAADGQWGRIGTFNSSSTATSVSFTVCPSGCDVEQDPARFVNATGHIRIRYLDTNNHDPKTVFSIDYQAVNLSRDVVRHDFAFGFGSVVSGRPPQKARLVTTSIGVATETFQNMLFAEVFTTGIDVGDAAGRLVDRSVSLSTSIAVVSTIDRAVQYERVVDTVFGFFDWLATLLQEAPEDDT